MNILTTFNVAGKPITEGSTTAFAVKRKSGKYGAVVTHSSSADLQGWRIRIAEGFLQSGGSKIEGAVGIQVDFRFIRPKSVSPKKRPHHTVKGDLDKYIRAIGDALTGYAYDDDAQIVSINASKRYCHEGEMEGATIVVYTIEEDELI